jgi:hypothetical protein
MGNRTECLVRSAAALALIFALTATAAIRTARAGAAEPLAGIVPPKNPPKNLAPSPDFYASCAPDVLDDTVACNTKILLAIDHARGTEPVGPLHFRLEKLLGLGVAEQLFAIADLERVSRGEPPMAYMTSQLDQTAAAGAVADSDPVLVGSTLKGGAQMSAWGSNWADGTESALGADDGWMYDDGYGSSNYDCRSPHAAGCWGHRDNVLRFWQRYLSGCKASASHLLMGAAYSKSRRFGTSFAEIFVSACGPAPTGVVVTWAQVAAAIGI